MGFDAVHYNLHKTFSQPHGGVALVAAQSGLRPICVPPDSNSFWRASSNDDSVGVGTYWYFWEEVGEKSIGKVQQWNGNAGAVVRAWHSTEV